MSLLPWVLKWRERSHLERFVAACREPAAAQEAVLTRLIGTNAQTLFGRDHGFGRIRSLAQWRAGVPMRDYEGLRPYMERLVAGERGVLTAEAPCMFTTTSGTTGSPKLIPVTPGWQQEMGALLRLWMVQAQADHPRCFSGKVLTIVSPAVEGHTAAGVPFGAMSGVTNQRAPWLLRRNYPVPYAAALIVDYDARYFVTLRLALAQALSAIVTPNPSTLMRLAALMAQHGETLLRALHDGTLGAPWPEMHREAGMPEKEFRRAIEAKLAPDPARARALGKLAEAEGKLLPRQAWPELVLIGCWLGGSAGLHARALAPVFGEHVALRDVGLLASEGRMTVPLEDNTAAGPLYVHANHYEFIPEDAIEEPSPRVLGAHELEDGGRYYLVLTGGNGLYRYDMNDVVEVQGFFHRTPKVAFLRKGRDMLNITGEKLHLNQVQLAVREAERAAGLAVWQFQLIPDVEASRYDLLVETRPAAPAQEALARFAEAFDAALCRLNAEYPTKRDSNRLGAPRLFVMNEGWAERLARLELSAGKRDVQFKWTHMCAEWHPGSRDEIARVPEDVPHGAEGV